MKMVILCCILYSIIYLFNTINIFVEQYYSLYRIYKYKISTLNRLKKYLFFVLFLLFILLFSDNDVISSIIVILINSLFINKSEIKKYHFTRRNTTLLVLSIFIISSLIISISHYSYFLVSIILVILNEVGFIISFYLLYPVELLIKNYYIKKARNKINKNKYLVIGVTGSFGKTTTKNFIYEMLSNKYMISRQNHNYNTVMGLCKYINNEVKDNDEILLVELGVDSRNQMKKFKKIFSLDYAIITSIGEMHLATFHNIENIAKEKLSIFNLLKKDGVIFLEKEIVKNYKDMINFKYITYSSDEIKYDNEFFYQIEWDNQKIQTNLISIYQLQSLSIALKIAKMLNVEKNDILFSLKNLKPVNQRCSIYYYKKLIIIDNSYNGNIKGIEDIINKFIKIKENKIVITGGLIELGNKYIENNQYLGKLLSSFNQIILVSNENNHPLINGINEKEKIKIVNSINRAYQLLENINEKTYVLVLCKGSDNYLK